MNKEIIITPELQSTVRSNQHIDKVHFDAKGRHYFNVHDLPNDKDAKDTGLYGSGLFSHNQVIPGKTNIDKLTEIISKGDPDTKIVKTMTRDEILSAKVKVSDETLAGKFVNSTEEQQKQFLASIGLTPNILAALSKLGEAKPEEPVKPVVNL
jgi:hypothetical protein